MTPKVLKKVRFVDEELGREGVARDFGTYWKFWAVDVGHMTFANYERLVQTARVFGYHETDEVKTYD